MMNYLPDSKLIFILVRNKWKTVAALKMETAH